MKKGVNVLVSPGEGGRSRRGSDLRRSRSLVGVRPPWDVPGTAQLTPVVLSSIRGSGGSLVLPCLQLSIGPPPVSSFEFYISSGDDLALYMDVRFNRYQDMRQVVCNSHQAGRWGAEVHQGGFPFKYNELFKFTITLTCQEFLVLLSDGSEIHFPNRLGATEYKDFSSDKGVLIHSFEIN
uniref:Galectin n=1 Tax=Gadus morhua TaxID=8049 RepID=A0A8C5AEB5_GADMO